MININFLKKNKLTTTINSILECIFIQLNEPLYLKQVQEKIISKIHSRSSFGFDISYSCTSEKFEDLKKPDIIFDNIIIKNNKDQINNLKILIIGNLIAGIDYTNEKFVFSGINTVDTKKCIKRISLIDKSLYDDLKKEGFCSLLNLSQIYFIDIEGISYLHIKELSDGDFIGFYKKNMYWIQHDDTKIILIPKTLENMIKGELSNLEPEYLESLLIEYCL